MFTIVRTETLDELRYKLARAESTEKRIGDLEKKLDELTTLVRSGVASTESLHEHAHDWTARLGTLQLILEGFRDPIDRILEAVKRIRGFEAYAEIIGSKLNGLGERTPVPGSPTAVVLTTAGVQEGKRD